MLQKLQKAIHTKFGQIVISIILGLGLASIFRKACDELNCLSFTAPKTSEVEKTIYKHGNDCFKFKATTKNCDKNVKSVRFA
uniref:Uncharacterized protein n=1 Tax=viral metagenome TaxID=1070528 RepID=A0A6C0CS14_9ZZZZ